MTIALEARNDVLRRLQSKVLPEACAFLFVFLIGVQMTEIGPASVLLQMGLMALLIASRPVDCLRILMRWWPLLLTPILAQISFLWSDLPMESARYGFQFLFTCFVGVLLANLLPPSRMLMLSFLALFVFCLLSIAMHRMGSSMRGPVLIGLTGSKNQMALAAFGLLVASFAAGLDKSLPGLLRFMAIPAIPVGLFVLATTDSATAVLIAGAAVPLLLVFHYAERFPPAGRIGAVVLAAIIVSPLIFIGRDLLDMASNFMFDSMGKDATLTGRTHLWAIADDLISRRPVFGYGYQSIWVGETADTLGILRWAGLTDGRTFNFHNTYRQIGVDTGFLGIAAFVCVMVAIAIAGLRQLLVKPSIATTYFFVNFIILVSMSFTEVILLPFLPRTLLLFICGVYAFRDLQPKPVLNTATARQTAWRRRR